MNDPINPKHYQSESGVQCIDVAENFPHNIGTAIKYAWRAGQKDDLVQDLEKCVWYCERAIANADDHVVLKNRTQAMERAARSLDGYLLSLDDKDHLYKGRAKVLVNLCDGFIHNVRGQLKDIIYEIEHGTDDELGEI